MSIPLVFFSSSNNTWYIAKLIALGIEEKGLKAELVRIEDLQAGKRDLTNADVIGIGAPIYGGFAEPIKEWVKSFNFSRKRVFLFSTAGIAHFGSTRDIISIVRMNNGIIIGAFEMTFRGCMDGIVYSKKLSKKYPINKRDLERAIVFGREVADIVGRGAGYVDSTYKHYFGTVTLTIIRTLKRIVLKMVKLGLYVIDKSKCTGCMNCKRACPSGAVIVKENNPSINHRLCISCFRCFKLCPQKALALRFVRGRPYYVGPWQLEGYIDPVKMKTASYSNYVAE